MYFTHPTVFVCVLRSHLIGFIRPLCFFGKEQRRCEKGHKVQQIPHHTARNRAPPGTPRQEAQLGLYPGSRRFHGQTRLHLPPSITNPTDSPSNHPSWALLISMATRDKTWLIPPIRPEHCLWPATFCIRENVWSAKHALERRHDSAPAVATCQQNAHEVNTACLS